MPGCNHDFVIHVRSLAVASEVLDLLDYIFITLTLDHLASSLLFGLAIDLSTCLSVFKGLMVPLNPRCVSSPRPFRPFTLTLAATSKLASYHAEIVRV
ncbi:hypothetical protein CY34DRAFT_143513 [Suillus luteus UH-Slu-Lm8-n1]|uniref:Uncharacterized protein n=1 Tax=Suillus luteus UH-Slu-Lm8-n1 TaxID=930992 RepID=A0A0D0AKT0_9AGAM|nr:hypothetical protein CY34DRAFT_143513 [Suillus luteus UH-Slu-Lm8-n1]